MTWLFFSVIKLSSSSKRFPSQLKMMSFPGNSRPMEANKEQQGYSRYRRGLEICEGIGGTSKIEAVRGRKQ